MAEINPDDHRFCTVASGRGYLILCHVLVVAFSLFCEGRIMFSRRSLTWCALLAVVMLVLAMSPFAQADVILWNDEQITVSSAMTETLVLYDTSHAFIVPGGSVPSLYAYNASTVDVSGGSMGWPSYAYNQSTVTLSSGKMASLWIYNDSRVEVSGGTVTGYLRPYDESTVDISGGSVEHLDVEDSSTVDMSGGSVDYLAAYDSNTLDISGGSMRLLQIIGDTTLSMSGGTIEVGLHTYGSSIANFYVRNFRLGGGLTLDGKRVLGTGILSGEWMDGTPRWAIDIATNDGAGIFISLVGVGDANCDGVVDEADASILADNWQTSTGATWREGDFNGDGGVDDADATMMAINWQQGLGEVTATIPEPGTFALLIGAVLMLFARHWMLAFTTAHQ